MPGLATRILSAVIALLILYGCFHFFDILGLAALACLISSIGIWEYKRLCFEGNTSLSLQTLFVLSCISTFLFSSFIPKIALTSSILIVTFMAATSLWLSRGMYEIQKIHQFNLKAVLGVFYAGLLPSLIVQMIMAPTGVTWFGLLLAITFIGDTCAYFGGLTFGKNRLMPDLSPKKSIEGSGFGLLGSVLGAVAYCHYFLPQSPWWIVGLATVGISYLCQTGDLFESLLKRLAGKKDSGGIMPGHGGVLDRLDGVYFGTPGVFLLFELLR